MAEQDPYLLIIPGFGETDVVFEEVASELAEPTDDFSGFEVVNPEVPRQFTAPNRVFPAEDTASFYTRVLSDLDSSKPVYVLGHSFAAESVRSILEKRKLNPGSVPEIKGVVLDSPTGSEEVRLPKLAARFAIHLAQGGIRGAVALIKRDLTTFKREVRAGVQAARYMRRPVRTWDEALHISRIGVATQNMLDLAEDNNVQVAYITREKDRVYKHDKVMRNLGRLAADRAWVESSQGDHNELHIASGQKHTTGLVINLLNMMQNPEQAKQDIDELAA